MKHWQLHFVFTAFSAITIVASGYAHEPIPPWQKATRWPDRVVSNSGAAPCRSLAITWRTDASVGETIAQFVVASADARFDLNAETVQAKTERINLEKIQANEGPALRPYNFGLGTVHYHSVVLDKLQPGTKYAWRVRGAKGCWSEWFQTSTAPETGPLTFVYFGDAQQGIRSHWSRVIRAAYEKAPDADFMLHAGDLVQQGDKDTDWAEWFDGGDYLHARIPTVPVVGNHEYIPVLDAAGKKKRVLTPLWRAQFTLPIVDELPNELHEAVYDLLYPSGVHLFVMNSAPSDFDVQGKWLDKKLSESSAKWRIVTMHHPYFIPLHSKRFGDNADRIRGFSDVIKKHKVDLVIVGHFHFYLRSTKPSAETPSIVSKSENETDDKEPRDRAARTLTGKPSDVETVFVISSSGAGVSQLGKELMIRKRVGDGTVENSLDVSFDRTAGNTPMFQVIRVDGPRLEFKAHTALGDTYDEFTITKSNGRKQLTNGKAAFGDVRLFENTGPFKEWHDLR